MKENILKLLMFITREGYDNTRWGVCDFEVETDVYFGTSFHATTKNFIYVYWKTDDEIAGSFLCNNDPDYFLSIESTADEYLFIFNY